MSQLDLAEELIARRIAHVAVGSSRHVSNEYKLVALDFIHNSDFNSFQHQFGPQSHHKHIDKVADRSTIQEAELQVSHTISKIHASHSPEPTKLIEPQMESQVKTRNAIKCRYGCTGAMHVVIQNGIQVYYCNICYLRLMDPDSYCVGIATWNKSPCRKPRPKNSEYCIYHKK